MSEQNKDFSFVKLLQSFDDENVRVRKSYQQETELGLSLGGPYNRPTSGSQLSQTDMPFLIRRFNLKGKPCTVRYHQVSSGCQQTSRTVPLPPDVEAEMNKPKEIKALNRIAAMKRSMLKKRSMKRQMQVENDEGKEEGWRSVKITKFEDKFENLDAESSMKNTTYCRAIEKLKYNHVATSKGRNPGKMPMMSLHMEKLKYNVLESSEVAWDASANQEVLFEIGKSTYYGERDILTCCTCHERNVAAYKGKEPEKMPMKIKREGNPPKQPSPMSPMPSITVVGPTGRKLEGVLFKFSTGQVTMVCRCHSHCFSPVDFVRHAGWDDVRNPMQHIKVHAPAL